jgi:MYXO-CTERM domain-containing protein
MTRDGSEEGDDAPRVLYDVPAVIADNRAAPTGVAGRLAEAARQLDTNVLNLRAGTCLDIHTEPDLDVPVLTIADGGPLPLTPGSVVRSPQGSTGGLPAGLDGMFVLPDDTSATTGHRAGTAAMTPRCLVGGAWLPGVGNFGGPSWPIAAGAVGGVGEADWAGPDPAGARGVECGRRVVGDVVQRRSGAGSSGCLRRSVRRCSVGCAPADGGGAGSALVGAALATAISLLRRRRDQPVRRES